MNLLYLFGGRFFWFVKRFKMVTAFTTAVKTPMSFLSPMISEQCSQGHLVFSENRSYPLVNIQKTMERSTIFHGKIHKLNGDLNHSYVK